MRTPKKKTRPVSHSTPTHHIHDQAVQRRSDHTTIGKRSTAASLQITLARTQSESNIASVATPRLDAQFASCCAMPPQFHEAIQANVSVSASYCIPQCVRLIAGGGGVDWAESTTGYTFTPCVGLFYFPWHRHHIEGTNGFYCLIRKTERSTISNVESQVFTPIIILAQPLGEPGPLACKACVLPLD